MTKRENNNFDESHLTLNTDIGNKKNEIDLQVNNNNQTKLEIIEEETNKYVDDLRKGTYNILVNNSFIKVAVRSRPLSQKEIENNEKEIIKVLDKKLLILLDPIEYNGHSEIFKNRSREQKYAFDYVFDQNCSQVSFSQHNVFINTTKFLLDGLVSGYNATVFAYGATGAGKTYTYFLFKLGCSEQKNSLVI